MNKIFKTIIKKLPIITGLLLLALFIWIVGSFAMNFLDSSNIQGKNKAVNSADMVKTHPSEKKRSFTLTPLFGKLKANKQVAPLPPKKIMKSNLNIKLVGTFMGPKPIALIQKAGKVDAYRIDDSITDSVKLLKIEKNRLVISHNNIEKSIEMEEGGSSSGQAISMPSLLPTPAETRDQENKSASPVENQSAATEKIRDLLVNKSISLSTLLVSKPAIENGSIVGFKISPKQDQDAKAVFDYLQLKANDTITEINGVSVTDYSKLDELKSALSSGSLMRITLQRAGKEKLLSVDLP